MSRPKLISNVLLLLLVSILLGQSPMANRVESFEVDDSLHKVLKKQIFAPNPTYGRVSFDLSSYPSKHYRIVVQNIIAVELWSQKYDSYQMDVDFGFLAKGTYLLSIENAAGERLLSKRLVIVTP